MEPEREELGEIEKLGAKAMRPARRVSDEDLIASEIACAILSEPLGKIRHACEALMLLDEGEREQAGITGDETKEAEKLHALALALQNTYVHQVLDSSGRAVDLYASIAWPFQREDAKTWLNWAEGMSAMYYAGFGDAGEQMKKKLENLGWCEKLYDITIRETTVPTYRTIMTRFEQYAMPKTTVLMRKIIRLVSPDSYKQALQLMRGGRRGKA